MQCKITDDIYIKKKKEKKKGKDTLRHQCRNKRIRDEYMKV